jgi:nucleoside-diphosphate-sugar epimerase
VHILLTGATGFLGFRTLEKLIIDSNIVKIIATGRTIKPSHHIINPKVTYELGDLSDTEFVKKVVSGVDVIIHAAALSSPWGSYEMFHSANVKSIQNLIHFAELFGVKRFIYISTPSMYFNGKDRFNIKESNPLPHRFVNEYANTKRMAELELEQSNLDFISLRPRALTGRGDTVIMPRLVRAFDEGRLRIIGDGKNIVDLTSVENVVDAIHLSMFAPKEALRQHYNITNGEPVVLWDKIRMVLAEMNRQLTDKKIPYTIVKSIAGAMEWKSKLTNKKEPTLTVYGVGTLAKSFTMDISKARELLGYVPKVSTDEAIIEFVEWYRKNEKN